MFLRSILMLILIGALYFGSASATQKIPEQELKSKPDVLIVGAGPAGLASALLAQSFGLHTRVLEIRQPNDFYVNQFLRAYVERDQVRGTHRRVNGRQEWNARDRNLLLDSSAVTVLQALGIKELMVSAIREFGFINGLGADAKFYPMSRGWISDLVLDVQMGRAFQAVGAISEIESALLLEYLRRGGQIEFATTKDSIESKARLKIFAGGSKSSEELDPVLGQKQMQFRSARYFVANIERSRVSWSRNPNNVTPVIFNFNADPNFPYTIAAMSHREKSTLYVTPYPDQIGDRDHSDEEVLGLMERAMRTLGISTAGPIQPSVFESRVLVREHYVFEGSSPGVVIGDAAHTTYPATGLGLSMALSDLVRLQPVFLAMIGKSNQTLEAALIDFEREMRTYDSRLKVLTHKALDSMSDVANMSRQNFYRFLFRGGKATWTAFFLSGWGKQFQGGIVPVTSLNVIDRERQLHVEPHGQALLKMLEDKNRETESLSYECLMNLAPRNQSLKRNLK